jgi:membrane complex biogenesis BtpA family protein
MSLPLTRAEFAARFGARAVIGMVHLLPLPGAPLYGGSIDAVLDAALRDAGALRAGGAAVLLFENFGDRPFRATDVDAVTVAAMTRVITTVVTELPMAFGVNVLRNDALSALAIAVATGAAFIRVNVHVGAMLTDQGVIGGAADATMRRRAELGAHSMAVFADHLVKHAVPLAPLEPAQLAKDLRLRGLADAVIVTGGETGAPPDAAALAALRQAIDAPLIVGSGLSAENAAAFRDADAAIVGTSIKRDGDVDAEVDRERVRKLVEAFGGA